MIVRPKSQHVRIVTKRLWRIFQVRVAPSYRWRPREFPSKPRTIGYRLNGEQIIRFLGDIECAVGRRWTLRWQRCPPLRRGDPWARRSMPPPSWESPSRVRGPVRRRGREEGRGLIKLVQLLIRWKAFNLDNLLTTWPTHYTFPISNNPTCKKHSPIPSRRLDTLSRSLFVSSWLPLPSSMYSLFRRCLPPFRNGGTLLVHSGSASSGRQRSLNAPFTLTRKRRTKKQQHHRVW